MTGGTPGFFASPGSGRSRQAKLENRLIGVIRFAAGLVCLVLMWLLTEPGFAPGMPMDRSMPLVTAFLVVLSLPLAYFTLRGAVQLTTGRAVGPGFRLKD